jgi:hypothetical protein
MRKRDIQKTKLDPRIADIAVVFILFLKKLDSTYFS